MPHGGKHKTIKAPGSDAHGGGYSINTPPRKLTKRETEAMKTDIWNSKTTVPDNKVND